MQTGSKTSEALRFQNQAVLYLERDRNETGAGLATDRIRSGVSAVERKSEKESVVRVRTIKEFLIVAVDTAAAAADK